jgi:hypothetical protein
VRLPCRGPAGCTGLGPASHCDDDRGLEGEACQQPREKDSYACTPDGAGELLCVRGTYALLRACHGPNGCVVRGDTINCDPSRGEPGDRCAHSDTDANYACTIDQGSEVVCDEESRSYRIARVCRGPRHCWIEGEKLYCDQSVARAGEACGPEGRRTCSEDHKAAL